MFRPWRERAVARNVVPQPIVLRCFRYRYPLKVLQKHLLKTSLLEGAGSYQQPVSTYLFYNIFARVIGFLKGGTPNGIIWNPVQIRDSTCCCKSLIISPMHSLPLA